MKEPRAYHIFHIYRKDGIPLFLHPFQDPAFFSEISSRLAAGEVPEIRGRFGREPRVESLTLFRNDLYRLIEQNVNQWMAEKRFIPRFLFSAGVFLVAYFFAAVVIRDPIPLVDELVIGLGASVLTYFLLGRQMKNSDMATKKRIQMRELVDKILFTESSLVREMEELLARNESRPPQELVDSLWSKDSPFSPGKVPGKGEETLELNEMLKYLERQFDRDVVRRHEKSISSGREQDASREADRLRRMKKFDLPLFSAYTKLKDFCRK